MALLKTSFLLHYEPLFQKEAEAIVLSIRGKFLGENASTFDVSKDTFLVKEKWSFVPSATQLYMLRGKFVFKQHVTSIEAHVMPTARGMFSLFFVLGLFLLMLVLNFQTITPTTLITFYALSAFALLIIWDYYNKLIRASTIWRRTIELAMQAAGKKAIT